MDRCRFERPRCPRPGTDTRSDPQGRTLGCPSIRRCRLSSTRERGSRPSTRCRSRRRGGPLGLRVYTPPGTGPFPLLVFLHGSRWVACDLDTHDPLCRNLCAGAGCGVASGDYRLAPEHRFPAAPDDCLAATRWAAEHAAKLGADPSRVAAVGADIRADLPQGHHELSVVICRPRFCPPHHAPNPVVSGDIDHSEAAHSGECVFGINASWRERRANGCVQGAVLSRRLAKVKAKMRTVVDAITGHQRRIGSWPLPSIASTTSS